MPGIYAGDTKSLVFPVMCNGYLKLEYETPNSEFDDEFGFWGHTRAYSIEAIISPFDCNGYGLKTGSDSGLKTSIKSIPSLSENVTSNRNTYQSELFSAVTARKNHKMMLFYNANVQFYLENTTIHNINQPAEYKLCVKIGSGTATESKTIIISADTIYGKYNPNYLYDGITSSKTLLDATTTISGTTVTCDSTENITVGTEIFNSNGVSLGTVQTIPNTPVNDDGFATTFTLSSATNYTQALYVSQPKEALYVETMYKVGFSYSNSGEVDLYLNGKKLTKAVAGTKTTNNTFATSNSFIGQDGTNLNTQFMGELYEICMYNGLDPTDYSTTINAGLNDMLFYYRFGDE